MKQLKEVFSKSGLIYKLMDRTDKVALYSLTIKVDKDVEEVVGYEVCKIYTKREKTVNGKIIEAHEAIPTDDQFGWDDDSKSFFPKDINLAKEYLQKYTVELQSKIPSNRLTIGIN